MAVAGPAGDPPSVHARGWSSRLGLGFLLVSLGSGALFLGRMLAAPLFGVCFAAIPDPSYYTAQVALSAALGLWAAACAGVVAMEFRKRRTNRGPIPAVGPIAAGLLAIDAVWYYLLIPWAAMCAVWPFGAPLQCGRSNRPPLGVEHGLVHHHARRGC